MPQKNCPNCNKPLKLLDFAPFCCKRCADVDLSRWLKGSYVIPDQSLETTDDAPEGRRSSEDEF